MNKERDDAITYVYNSTTIHNMLLKVKSEDRAELKSYLIECLLEKPEKLVKAYNDGYLDFWIWSMIQNQYFSNTSPFRRKIMSFKTSELNFDITHQEDDKNSLELIYTQIETILRGCHWFDKTLFDLYYVDGMTYKQIEKETGIYYLTVRRSVMKVLDKLKKNIKIDDNDYSNN